MFVIASAAGSDRHPAWFHNLLAHPDQVTVEIGRETLPGHAQVLGEPERTDVYTKQAERYPRFAAYQKKTERRIPVIALTLDRDVVA